MTQRSTSASHRQAFFSGPRQRELFGDGNCSGTGIVRGRAIVGNHHCSGIVRGALFGDIVRGQATIVRGQAIVIVLLS